MATNINIGEVLTYLHNHGIQSVIKEYPELKGQEDILKQIELQEAVQEMHLNLSREAELAVDNLANQLRFN
jgi:Ni,Fe-hydrogenase maturation factor